MARFLDENEEMIDKLKTIKTIALIGASPNVERPSNHVLEVLLEQGFDVYPVNPGQAGKTIHGRKVYASLKDIDAKIDMVDIFRAGDAVPAIVDEALTLEHKPSLIWMQLDVMSEEGAQKALDNDMDVVMNHCPVIEMGRARSQGRW